MTEATAKEAVSIFVQIPTPYIGEIECAVNAETVAIRSLECESIELDIKTPNVILADVTGTVEINCNLDMEVVCHSLNGGGCNQPSVCNFKNLCSAGRSVYCHCERDWHKHIL